MVLWGDGGRKTYKESDVRKMLKSSTKATVDELEGEGDDDPMEEDSDADFEVKKADVLSSESEFEFDDEDSAEENMDDEEDFSSDDEPVKVSTKKKTKKSKPADSESDFSSDDEPVKKVTKKTKSNSQKAIAKKLESDSEDDDFEEKAKAPKKVLPAKQLKSASQVTKEQSDEEVRACEKHGYCALRTSTLNF